MPALNAVKGKVWDAKVDVRAWAAQEWVDAVWAVAVEDKVSAVKNAAVRNVVAQSEADQNSKAPKDRARANPLAVRPSALHKVTRRVSAVPAWEVRDEAVVVVWDRVA